MSRLLSRSVVLLTSLFAASVNAGTLGLLEGRSAQPDQTGQTSVEVGYLSEGDFSTIAGRVSYQLSPPVTLYGDFGLIDLGDADGSAFGLGVRYHLAKQRLLPMLDASVRASYHTGSADFNAFGGNTDTDLAELSFAVHVGSKEAFLDNGMKWYGVLSYNRTTSEVSTAVVSIDSTDADLGLGGGVYMPFGPGEVYVGVENINELFFGLGYRHFIGRNR
ncbi:MAG: hypothetical protein AB8B84_00110 [Granulosicoccus sp.]